MTSTQAHPDWIMVTEDGQPRRHWADPELWVTCALGPYNFEFMTEVTREIVGLYPVDGVFSNRWTGHGTCYCAHCRRAFRDATGHDLPRGDDRRGPARKAYLAWRQDRLFELWDVWDAAVREAVPHARFIPNAGGAHGELDMKRIGEKAEILFADRQARRGLMPAWANGRNGKEFRATLGRKPIGGIFSVGVEERYRWKDSVQSPAEIRLFVADGVANGLRPWWTKFCGMVYDPRWLEPVAEMYRLYHAWEPYLRNEAPVARVGLLYSQQTWAHYGAERAEQTVEDHTRGMYHALVEARIPFEMVHDGLLDEAHLAPFKTLVLPNIAALSDAQCRQLRAFVERGGSLVATHETSLYDEWGARREDFGLGDLFGARYAGGTEGPMQNSYLAVRRDPLTRAFHPLVAGLEDAGRIINGVHRVKVEPTTPLPSAPLTLIESYPDLPMEMVWPRVPDSDVPQVYARQHGEGQGGLLPLGHRPLLLGGAVRRPRAPAGQRRAVGHQRGAARHRHRPRRAGRHRLGPAALPDRAPGQPDQPHDDEGAPARADPGRRAGGAPAPPGGPGGGRGEAAPRRDRARGALRGRRAHRARPLGPGARGRRGRLSILSARSRPC